MENFGFNLSLFIFIVVIIILAIVILATIGASIFLIYQLIKRKRKITIYYDNLDSSDETTRIEELKGNEVSING